MSLRFIVGKSGTGKTFVCLEEMTKKQAEAEMRGVNLIYTVPEQNTLSAERSLIAHTKGKCIMNAKVLSFKRLSYRIFSELGYSGKTLLGEAGQLMAIRRIAAEKADKLEFFSSVINKEGVLDRLSHSVKELLKSNLLPEDLDGIAEGLEEGSPLHAKLRDLKHIYSGYLEFLKEGYSSPEEALNVLSEKLSQSEIIENSEVWIDGFYSFSPQELKIIEGMLLRAKRVSVVLNMDKESFLKGELDMSEPYFEPWNTADILLKTAHRLGVPAEDTLFLDKVYKYKTEGMKALSENFHKAVPESCENSRGVYIFAAEDRFSESQDAAEKINALVRKNGYRYREIGVLSREVADYARIISGVFDQYDIPFFIDKTADIREHPFIKMVLSMLDTAAGGFLYEDVFSYVKTGFTDLSDGEADLLENYVLKYGIKGNKYFDTWFFGFADNDPKKDFINSARERLVLPFCNFVNGIKREKTYECKEICSAFLAFLEDLKAEEKILAVSEAFMEAGDRKSADTTKRVYEKVLELIDKTIEILGRETMTLKEFAEIFRAGLAKSDLGIVPPENDMVVVGDLERTRLNGVKVLFVLGANDGVVPKAPEPMGVFSDSEAETFEEMGISAIKGGKRASFEENYLIQIGLLQPSEILRLSYCTMDSEGKELSPSLIINKIKRIFPGIQTADSRKYKDEITLGEPSMHKLSEHLSSGEELSPAWNAVLEYALRDERYRHNVKNMQRAQTDNAYEKNLSPENAERFFGGKRLSLSATGMGLYSGCPFAYFVKYGLKAKEREIYEVNAPHLGTVFHSVLERFSKELAEEKIAWTDLSKEEMESRINRAVDSIAPDYYEKILLSKGGYKYLITRLKRISAKACAALAEHIKRGSFKPLGYEVGFGADEALPPIAVKLSDGREIVMRGKIDRVDIYRRDGDAYVKIIDYKSSGKDIDLLSVYYGIELQLMVYMWALMERGNLILTERLIPGGVFYFGLKKPVENSGVHKELTADEIKSLIFKSFKMNGLVLADEDVVRAMDNDINKSSDIIPVEFNKDGSMAKKSKVLEEADFRAVLEHSMDMFREIGEGISSGRIEPSPYKLKSVNNCTTCGYKSVCRFDPKKKDDKFRILQKKSEDEVLRIIRSEQENRV